MPAITLNPGFVLLLAAFAVLTTPKGLRAATIAAAAILALWLLLDHEFGAAATVAQMGLPVRLLVLDPLNRIFGLGLLLVLVIVAIASNARQNRFEDAAILLSYGSALTALFVGDLVSFIAAMSLSGLAGAWTIFCSPLDGANRAGGRALIWRGLEGLLFLVGLAFHLAASEARSEFVSLDLTSIGGCFIFVALLIRVGAPFVHSWYVDVAAFSSPVGAMALAPTGAIIGLYALARFYQGESILMWIGVALIVLGLFYAAAEDDLRRSAAYAVLAQTGLFMLLIGVGTPLAMAAAEGGVFSAIFASAAMFAVLGGVVDRKGRAQRSQLAGLAKAMPVTGMLMLASGLSLCATPAFASFATHTVALDALAQQEAWLRVLVGAIPAWLLACLAVAPALTAFRVVTPSAPRHEAKFSLLLSAGLALFFSVSVGLAPDWLYNLMPTQLSYSPYAADRLAAALQLVGASALAAVILYGLKAWPRPEDHELLDIDALYRGPVSAGARWCGILALRIYGAWHGLMGSTAKVLTGAAGAWIAAQDRPYARVSAAIQIAAVAVALVIALVSQRVFLR